MATRRKPTPSYALLRNPDDAQGSAEPVAPTSEQNITRYTLTDGPYPPSDAQYQQEPEAGPSDSPSQLSHRQSRIAVRNPSLPPLFEATDESSAGDRDSLSTFSSTTRSTSTYIGSDQYHGNPKDYLPKVASSPYRPLPTINSGEPLDWEKRQSTYSEDSDPFVDYETPVPRLGGDQYQAAPGLAYENVRNVRHSLSTSGHSTSTLAPNHTSYYTPSPLSIAPSIYTTHTGYSHSQSDGSTSYGTPYSPVDHFRYDTEAYASGVHSHAVSQAPYSRSPTPTPDDEYYITGAGDVYGGEYSPQRDSGSYDDFDYKEHLQTRLQGTNGGDGYLHPHADPEKSLPSNTSSPYPEPLETPVRRHFGPAPPGRILRRHKTKKRVKLRKGNLVVDLPVPPKLVLPRRGEEEMLSTRYTAVTCDPDEFEENGFDLRQIEYERSTELFIVITMYNEDEVLFCRTLYGVMQNISHLCTRKNSRTWGPDAWKKVVVCIVADGRKKIHPRVLDCLTLLGVYQPGDHMKNMVNNKPVTAHLFEYTATFGLDPNLRFRYPDKGVVPTQILFCMKEKNQKKINSHRWFFNAFGKRLQPNVCVLLDVGTRPDRKSIYHLWKTFDLNSNVAGACGEIAAYKGKHWLSLLNPLVAAQNFEYKIANILDKPTESLFGYISVLPGAFSAYRYIALQNDKQGCGPLASYFKGEVLHGRDTDIFTSNMYLAEDRILCFELVAKANSDWVLRYVKSASAETDVPDALPEFISQRRRWLNGSFFAATYAIAHLGQILRSGHSMARKFSLVMETIYNIINLVAAWFAIGNFYLFFIILTSSLENDSFGVPGIKYFNAIVQFVMGSIVIACFLFSMGNKPRASKWKYKLSAILLSCLMMYMIACAVLCAIQAARSGGTVYNTMVFSVIITYGVYVLASLLALDPWHIFTSFIPYLLLSPTYINILNVYAFCNLDDISWGTKQDTETETDLGAVTHNSNAEIEFEVPSDVADVNGLYEDALENIKKRKSVPRPTGEPSAAEQEQTAKDYYASVRTNVLLSWVLSNALLLVAILGGADAASTFSNDGTFTRTKAYMTFILAFVAITTIVRLGGSTMYLIARIFTG
ncbi:glycosyltransferase family 2 protein [Wolfiporia cocos MD-104 SS10]|uniref:chitin synthase n=1 Tax=Wolfiporia cocos (strain MD-104) TaxID=742152 RepID=A0A2H3JTT4_WOLCO|nr:glycosyltransferase family 2 protein [Wolfiporia cocos MD-104 SS10]